MEASDFRKRRRPCQASRVRPCMLSGEAMGCMSRTRRDGNAGKYGDLPKCRQDRSPVREGRCTFLYCTDYNVRNARHAMHCKHRSALPSLTSRLTPSAVITHINTKYLLQHMQAFQRTIPEYNPCPIQPFPIPSHSHIHTQVLKHAGKVTTQS